MVFYRCLTWFFPLPAKEKLPNVECKFIESLHQFEKIDHSSHLVLSVEHDQILRTYCLVAGWCSADCSCCAARRSHGWCVGAGGGAARVSAGSARCRSHSDPHSAEHPAPSTRSHRRRSRCTAHRHLHCAGCRHAGTATSELSSGRGAHAHLVSMTLYLVSEVLLSLKSVSKQQVCFLHLTQNPCCEVSLRAETQVFQMQPANTGTLFLCEKNALLARCLFLCSTRIYAQLVLTDGKGFWNLLVFFL